MIKDSKKEDPYKSVRRNVPPKGFKFGYDRYKRPNLKKIVEEELEVYQEELEELDVDLKI